MNISLKKLMTILLAVVLFSQILPHRLMIYALETEEALDEISEVETIENEESKEIESYPSINKTVELGAYTVTVNAPQGIFSEGTTVNIDEVSVPSYVNLDGETMLAVDITFIDENGNEVEPEKGQNVSVKISSKEIKEEDNIEVFHISNSNDIEVVDIYESEDTVVFESDSFSIYVLNSKYEFNGQEITTKDGKKTSMNVKANVPFAVELYDTSANALWSIDSDELDTAVTDEGTFLISGTPLTAGKIIVKHGSNKFTITVESNEQTYSAYYYALIPGATYDKKNPNGSWLGIGVAKINGVTDPKLIAKGTVISSFELDEEEAEVMLFPEIKLKTTGRVFKYAPKGSKEENKDGYYTLEFAKVVVSDGANAGNNSYNPTVSASINTYHVNFNCSINETDYFFVKYMVKNENSDSFDEYEDYSQRVALDTPESDVEREKPANKDGYLFKGWYLDEECTVEAEFNGEVKEDITYYGKYVSLHTITWKSEDVVLKTDENIIEGTMPEYTGEKPVKAEDAAYTYEFDGWTPEIVPVSEDTVYNAVFKPIAKKFTVTYDANGGKPEEPVTFTVDYGTKTPGTDNPERKGYRFMGWDKDIAETVTEDVTYTAQWKRIIIPVSPDEPGTVVPVKPAKPVIPNIPETVDPVKPVVEPVEEKEVIPEIIPEIIPEEVTPQATIQGTWALVNLLMTVLSALLAIVTMFAKKKSDDDADEEDRYERDSWPKYAGFLVTLLSVILFILTEDITEKMVLFDKWTIIHIMITMSSILLTYLGYVKYEPDNKEEIAQA